MLIKKSITLFGLFNFTIVLTKSSFQLTTSLSNILHVLSVSIKHISDSLIFNPNQNY